MDLNKIASILNIIAADLAKSKNYMSDEDYKLVLSQVAERMAPLIIKSAANQGKVQKDPYMDSSEFTMLLNDYATNNSPISNILSSYIPQIDQAIMEVINPETSLLGTTTSTGRAEAEKFRKIQDNYRTFSRLSQARAILGATTFIGKERPDGTNDKSYPKTAIDNVEKLKKVAFLLKGTVKRTPNGEIVQDMPPIPVQDEDLAKKVDNVDLITPDNAMQTFNQFAYELKTNPVVIENNTSIDMSKDEISDRVSKFLKSTVSAKKNEIATQLDELLDITRLDERGVGDNSAFLEQLRTMLMSNDEITPIDKKRVEGLIEYIKDNKPTTLNDDKQSITAKKQREKSNNKLWNLVERTIDRCTYFKKELDRGLSVLYDYYQIGNKSEVDESQYVDSETGVPVSQTNAGQIAQNRKSFRLSNIYGKIQQRQKEITEIQNNPTISDEFKTTYIDQEQQNIQQLLDKNGVTLDQVAEAYANQEHTKELINMPIGKSMSKLEMFGSPEDAEKRDKAFEVVRLFAPSKYQDFTKINPSHTKMYIDYLKEKKEDTDNAIYELTAGTNNIDAAKQNLFDTIKKEGKPIIYAYITLCNKINSSFKETFDEIDSSISDMLDEDIAIGSTLKMSTDNTEIPADLPESFDDPSAPSYSTLPVEHNLDNTPDVVTSTDIAGEQSTDEVWDSLSGETLEESDPFKGDILPTEPDSTDKKSFYKQFIKLAMGVLDEALKRKQNKNQGSLNDLVDTLSSDVLDATTSITQTTSADIALFISKVADLKQSIIDANDKMPIYAQDMLANINPINTINDLKQEVIVLRDALTKALPELGNVNTLSLMQPQFMNTFDEVTQKQVTDYKNQYSQISPDVSKLHKLLLSISAENHRTNYTTGTGPKETQGHIIPTSEAIAPAMEGLNRLTENLSSIIAEGMDKETINYLQSNAPLNYNKVPEIANKAIELIDKYHLTLPENITTKSISEVASSIGGNLKKLNTSIATIMNNSSVQNSLRIIKTDESINSSPSVLLSDLDSILKIEDQTTLIEDLRLVLDSPIIKSIVKFLNKNKNNTLAADIINAYSAVKKQYGSYSENMKNSIGTATKGIESIVDLYEKIKEYATTVKQYTTYQADKSKDKTDNTQVTEKKNAVEFLNMIREAITEKENKIGPKSLLKMFGYGSKRKWNNISKGSSDKDTTDISLQKTWLAQNTLRMAKGQPPIKYIDWKDTQESKENNSILNAIYDVAIGTRDNTLSDKARKNKLNLIAGAFTLGFDKLGTTVSHLNDYFNNNYSKENTVTKAVLPTESEFSTQGRELSARKQDIAKREQWLEKDIWPAEVKDKVKYVEDLKKEKAEITAIEETRKEHIENEKQKKIQDIMNKEQISADDAAKVYRQNELSRVTTVTPQSSYRPGSLKAISEKSEIVFSFVKDVAKDKYNEMQEYMVQHDFPIVGLDTFVDKLKSEKYPGYGVKQTELATVYTGGGLAEVMSNLVNTVNVQIKALSKYADAPLSSVIQK